MTSALITGFDYWDDPEKKNTVEAIAREFTEYSSDPLDLSYADVKVAVYTYESYSGEAFVLYRDTRDGKFYEVNGSHCSCYGLEGQWKPEEIEPKELINRPAIVYGPHNELIRHLVAELFAE